MKRLCAAALLAVLAAAPAARSEEPYLEFIRNLRKTYPDLALDYLTRLGEKPPPSVAKYIPLEKARTRLDLASTVPELDERLEQYKNARLEFEEFLANDKNNPLAATIEMDIGRVLVLQGRTQLSRALAEDSVNAQQVEADKARRLISEGIGRLAQVRDKLEKQLNRLDAKTDDEKRQKRDLEDARQQCQFEEAQAWLDQIRTYVKSTEEADRARNEAAKKGSDLMARVASGEPKNALAWEAEAWLILFNLNTGDRSRAAERYAAILKDAPKDSAAVRLARYFILEVYASENLPAGILPAGQKAVDVIRTNAEKWVQEYPRYLKTYEGYGVQFKLAEALRVQAAAQSGKAKEETLARVKSLCRAVEQGESEWTSKARRMKLDVMFEEKAFDKPISTLTTFDDCFVRAQYEIAQIDDDPKAIDKDVEKKSAKVQAEIKKLEDEIAKLPEKDATRKKKEAELAEKRDELDAPELKKKKREERLRNAIAALNQALKLADKAPKPPEKDVLLARVGLAFTYMTRGRNDDLVKAIDLGEELARIKTRPPESAKGAIFALETMWQLLSQGERSGFGPDELKKYRERFVALADYMKKSWPADQPGDVARHQTGLLDIREGRYAEAAKELGSIKPGYPGAVHVHYQLAMAALGADKAGEKTADGDPDNRPWKERALAALESMPPLSETADEGANYTYLLAQTTLGRILYVDGKYDELEKMATAMKERVTRLKLPEDPAKDLKAEMASGFATLQLLARFGKANAAFKEGKLTEVTQILDPVIKEVTDGKAQDLANNPELRAGIFGLALRAAIQDGKLDKATAVIAAIQKTAGEDGGDGEVKTLFLLSGLINEQMRELRKKNQPEQIAKAQGAFTKLLDGMLDTIKKGGKELTLEQSYGLAKAFANLGNHKRAAELLAAIARPKDEKDERAMGQYYQVRVEYARQLRQDSQLDAAEKEITALVGTEKQPGPAAKNIDARKEVIYLAQDREKYGTAGTEWNKLIKQITPAINQPGMKDNYFEAYYNLVYCVVKSAKKADASKAPQLYTQASSLVVNLEKQYSDRGGEEWKAKYDDLIETTPELKKEYETQKAQAKPK